MKMVHAWHFRGTKNRPGGGLTVRQAPRGASRWVLGHMLVTHPADIARCCRNALLGSLQRNHGGASFRRGLQSVNWSRAADLTDYALSVYTAGTAVPGPVRRRFWDESMGIMCTMHGAPISRHDRGVGWGAHGSSARAGGCGASAGRVSGAWRGHGGAGGRFRGAVVCFRC